MRFKHTCLDGTDRWGQELDCESCRVLLLASFRGPDRPVDRPRPDRFPVQKAPPLRYEHLHDPEPGFIPAVQDGPAAHVVRCRLDDGLWSVVCACGWFLTGPYPPDEESSGRAVAEAIALAHAMDPEGDQ